MNKGELALQSRDKFCYKQLTYFNETFRVDIYIYFLEKNEGQKSSDQVLVLVSVVILRMASIYR